MKNILFSAAAAALFLISACKKDERNIEQFDNDNIQAYIRSNNLDVQQLGNTGIYYQVVSEGTGDSIRFDRQIPIIYSLRSLDGSYVNNDTIRTRFANFFGYFTPDSLRNVIKNGLVREGGVIRVLMPSRFAYKTEGVKNGVPGNASLDYTFHVLNTKALTSYNDAVIQKYMQANSLTGFTRTASGLYYKIGSVGGDTTIRTTSTVNAIYTGKLLNGEVFDSPTSSIAFLLSGTIPGWIEGLQLIRSGGSIRLIIPPTLAYGNIGSTNPQTGSIIIPPFSTLDFDINISSVTNTDDGVTEE